MGLVVHARELVGLSEKEMWDTYNRPRYKIDVHCEDGEMVHTSGRGLLYTWYGFQRMHAAFPAMKILKDHIIQDKVFNAKVQEKYMSALLWDCWDAIDGAMEPSDIALHVQMVVNDLYNVYVEKLSSYVTSLSILDFVEICSDERAEKAMEEAKPTEASIAEVYAVNLDVVRDDENRYPKNNIVRSFNAGILKQGQLLQNISIRGFVTDSYSNIFEKPIMSGFCRGMNDIRDVLTERCSASKALLMAGRPLAETEYLNRRIQLVANVITSLLRGNGRTLYSCTGYKTINFTVSKRNIRNLEGKYYVDMAGVEHRVDINDEKLIGSTLALRSGLGCAHRHEGRICGKCLGDISWSLEIHDNLGHQASMELCPLTSQSVLSTKHLDASSTSTAVAFPSEYEDTLRPSGDGLGARFTSRVKRKGILTVPYGAMQHINDLFLVENLALINPLHFSSVTKVSVSTSEGGDVRRENSYNVTMAGVNAYFTAEFLAYIKETGFSTDSASNYTVDLTGWDTDKAVFLYPKRHRNMIDFMNATAGMIESKGTKTEKLSDYETESEALAAFSDLIYSTFDVNIAHLEILITAVLARDPESLDHNIPRVDEPVHFGNVDQNIMNRSLSSKLAYENQVELLHAPASYTNRRRLHHSMDWVFS